MSVSVLVVDDEPMTRDLLRMMLEHARFNVLEAEDGLEALEKVKQHRPDLIVLDVMMPNMDGLTVCRILRGQEATAELPIVMLSAKISPEDIEAGLRAGATSYLTKPVSRKDLIQHLEDVLSNVSTAQT